MRILARGILVLIGLSLYSVLTFGIAYWTREGKYFEGTQIPWVLGGLVLFIGIPVLITFLIGLVKVVGKLFSIAELD